MVDLYLMSPTDQGWRLRKSLEGSLPGLKVEGPVLEGRGSVEGQRRLQELAGLRERRGPMYRDVLDYDGVVREHRRTK